MVAYTHLVITETNAYCMVTVNQHKMQLRQHFSDQKKPNSTGTPALTFTHLILKKVLHWCFVNWSFTKYFASPLPSCLARDWGWLVPQLQAGQEDLLHHSRWMRKRSLMGEQVSWKDTLLAESCWLASEHQPLHPWGNTQRILSTVITTNDNYWCQSAD